ncbi:flagellar hook-associated protein 3 [Pseudomonas juntendi]|uniref:Flagellar hook-associated protein 3 n=1 Tax=Pseudomonas putida TaxID=303 RepID=A0A1X0ZRI0_PSEPU|nr:MULTISPECIES: flagellar hook-associated protein 3 [Pseudomonas]EKT4521077.1 flagellar hook-associated protein 3 [Pseudomonas putida]MEB3899582.1 flagellar hook-associated protein 3 [Pseudomonas putida]ORL62139.1 flagellar hook-associated protein 3 [Pseudomonas putida]UBM23948.1 flagellar hook-associated protein 3 [Pseudomonas sp. p1(2021b)]
MRISTAQFYETNANTYSRNFSSTAKTMEQITSKSRIQTAGDDPVGAARLLLLQQQSALLGQYSANMTTVNNALLQEESVLSTINDALQRASELAIQAGNGGLSDADRTSISKEIKEIEANVFGLLNSRDANGDYMFGGSKTSSPPYVRNSDGTYSYRGDQTQLSLQVSDTLHLATNDSGYSIFDQAINNSRTQSNLTAPLPDDGRVGLSQGLLGSVNTYNDKFGAGQPYTITFKSATEYSVTDAAGNDITSETPTNGKFDRNAEGGDIISLRGVEFEIDINLQEGDDPDTAIANHSFTVEAKPDTLTATRSAGNGSTAQVTGTTITDGDKYRSTFPSDGAVIKFTSDTEFALYAQPYSADSKPVATGTLDASNSLTVAGVTFQLDGPPGEGDQFSVTANTHRTQNVLDTLGQLRSALEQPVDSPQAQAALKSATDSAISNLASARERIDITRGSIGARGNSLEIQLQENTSLDLANKSTQSAIGDTDMASATITLTLQQAMLEASQLAFARISQLSLFNKL